MHKHGLTARIAGKLPWLLQSDWRVPRTRLRAAPAQRRARSKARQSANPLLLLAQGLRVRALQATHLLVLSELQVRSDIAACSANSAPDGSLPQAKFLDFCARSVAPSKRALIRYRM